MDMRAMKAMQWKKTCIACGKTFTYSDGFECPSQPGNHTVEAVTYYHLGAGHIQNRKERRLHAPMLNLKANIEVRDKVTGQITQAEGIIVHFKESGIYETANPEEQYYLDQHPQVRTGAEGYEGWEKMYLTPEQQAQKAEQKLADLQKQIKEGNALLDVVKTRQKENSRASV